MLLPAPVIPPGSIVRCCFSSFQSIAPSVVQFQEVTGVRYPALYEDFIAEVDLFNVDVGFIASFARIPRTNLYNELLYATLYPVVVIAVLAGLYTHRKNEEESLSRGNAHLEAQALVRYTLRRVLGLVLSFPHKFQGLRV